MYSLAALSSARGPCLGQALSMLVDKFKLGRSADWTVPDFPVVSLSLARDRVHLGLQYLLNVFPVARSILCNLLVSKYPYQDEPKSIHVAYIDNLLRLQQYEPDLERDIMELLTRKMVELDVSMQLDLDNTDDEITQVVLQQLEPRQSEVGADEEEDDDSDLDSVHSDDSDLDEIELQIIFAKRNIKKLDFIIHIIFEFYAPRFSDPDSVEAMAAFTQLCSDFINIVLPTSKTRHSQFLLFHFAQKSPQLTDAFLGTLLTISEDTTRPLIVRRAAIAYIASFVARGARLSPFLTQQVVQTLWRRMDSYRIVYEPACHGPDLQRYSLYYELAQGLMFVFCYRWRDLVVSVPASVDPDVPASFIDKDLEWIDDLQGAVRRNVRSRLNPLKVCSATIVEQFAKMSRHLRLDYIYPILAANRAIHLSQVMPAAYHNGGALRESGYDAGEEKWAHLEANAQFDPFQLPDSKHWIDGDYISWQNIPGLNDDDDDGQEYDGQNQHYESDSEVGEEEDLEENEELGEATATEEDE
jgi:RNA polymerase I-specific transcription initiation factor RRN3